MLSIIIQKEIKDLISSTKFAITFGVAALLIILAFYSGAYNHKQAITHYEAAKAENVRQIDGLTDWFALESYRIFLPPRPLESLVQGISGDIGRTVDARSGGDIAPENSRFNEAPVFAVFRLVDLEFIFKVVLSLFAILLGYDAISGEKERGTLRLTFANSVPRATFILGKLIGSFVTLALSLSVAFGLGCLLFIFSGIQMSSDDWMRLALIITTGLLYFGVFLTMSIFISAMTERTSSSFLALLVIWIAAVIIIPRVSVILAGRAVDVPSVDQISAQKASLSRQLWKEFMQGMKDFKAPEMDESQGVDAMMAAFNQYSDSMMLDQEKTRVAFAKKVNEERHNRQNVQEKLAFNIARISPATSLTLATSRFAGTSLDLKDQFYEQARLYRESFTKFLDEKTGMKTGGRMFIMKISDSEDEPPEPIDPTEIPAFEYRQEALTETINATMGDIGLLLFFNILFFSGGFAAFLRYDLR